MHSASLVYLCGFESPSCQDLFSSLVLHFNGSYQLEYHPDGCGDSHLPVLLDFTPPWPRVSIVEEVEGLAERQIPRDFNSEECNEVLEDIAFTNNVQCCVATI